ncbi:hypothetical protein ACFB49_33990 [Sphingomonas sp. DBB INV C78]|uniref:RidA family protein n=1 Tax=Sphingomonas sp. DBB INV C78 TaxID=3349434 RepID=UPI0036D39888
MNSNIETSPPFANAVRAGDLLFCSGMIGLEADGTVPSEPARQFALAFQALRETLAHHGCGAEDVVDLTTFHVDFPTDMDRFMLARSAFLDERSSAWTAVGVAALGYPGSIVEIKAIARVRG